MYNLAQEKSNDWWEVEALYDLCFAPGREALSSYRLRDGVDSIAELCLILRDLDSNLSAAIRFWPVRVGGQAALLLGPIAVHPTRQGEGLGRMLIAEGLTKAKDLGWERVLLVGDAPYYEKQGFQQLSEINMPPPTNPARVLGCALCPEAWKGITGDVESVDSPKP